MPSTDSGERIYAVGDIHGCYDLLRQMVDVIGDHSARLPPVESLHLMFIGDLIDRGGNSAKVLEFLHDLQTRSDRVIVLQGNHEEAMLRALAGDMATLRGWLNVGGRDTLRSFGINPPGPDDDMRDFLRRARVAIPRQWVQWMQRLPLTAQSGDYFFCHAGVRPGVPLRRQAREDLLWIRDDFLYDESDHGAVIVHGHSIEPTVQIRPNRIGIDTGAYRTGRLSAIYLEGDRSEVLTVGA
ncbi:metallophosphoesterase family protein [Sphingomonas sp. Leaf4]|uniref:metallophosphoesterase family protein n=1 Tax=Sphingomonas sp. Leaf4 TaxID=2876553 RepID=UPI001E4B0A51|nr:metallophosphoesterase family protein [Sphingomonas sp. Leaf4]